VRQEIQKSRQDAGATTEKRDGKGAGETAALQTATATIKPERKKSGGGWAGVTVRTAGMRF
jgi:hypothetical protein